LTRELTNLVRRTSAASAADGADASAAAAAAPQSFGSRGYSLSKIQSKILETPGMGKP